MKKFSKIRLITWICCEEILTLKFVKFFVEHYKKEGVHTSHMIFILHIPSRRSLHCLQSFKMMLEGCNTHEIIAPYDMVEPLHEKLNASLQQNLEKKWNKDSVVIDVEPNQLISFDDNIADLVHKVKDADVALELPIRKISSDTTNLLNIRPDITLGEQFELEEDSEQYKTAIYKIGDRLKKKNIERIDIPIQEYQI